MAKFRVTVSLPPDAVEDPVSAIATAMRPFDQNIDPATREDGYNPQGEWDGWQISSYDNLVVRPEYAGDARLVHRPTGPSASTSPSPWSRRSPSTRSGAATGTTRTAT